MTALQPVVLDLADARELALAGGKAVNLAELLGAGFAVPDGFCVGTPAYAQAAATADLDAVLDERSPDLPRRARRALMAVPMPDDVADTITAAYAALGDQVPVAVRSSATAEDLPGASFAGQQDTYLNVVGADAVLDAVRRCWASLWTDRAVAYRAEAGIDHATAQLAVVVQRMVDAQVAGVLFTADPISGRRTSSVIDAAPGLGDAVVSGTVDPDHWVVDEVGPKVVRGNSGHSDSFRARPGVGACLDDGQVRALVELGRRVEAHFGSPQDIEWAIDPSGKLWLTQSRAITTLYPVPPSQRPGLRVHLNATLAQGLTRPMTPMGLSAFRVVGAAMADVALRQAVDSMVGPAAFGIAGARAFIDITAAVRNPIGRRLVPLVFDVMESRSAVVIRALLAEEPSLRTTGSVWSFVRPVLRVLLRYRAPALLVLSLVRPDAARRHVARIGDRLRARIAQPVSGDGRARFAHVVQSLREIFPIMPTTVPVAGAGFLALGLARRVAGFDLDAQDIQNVLRGLPHNVTTEMDLQLWAIATRLDAESADALRSSPSELAARYQAGTLPMVLQRELGGFLAEHGHRTVAEIDLGMPRWSDDPTQVLGSLANYLRLTDPDPDPDPADHPDVRFSRGAAAAEAAVADVVARVRRHSRLRAVVTNFALRRTRQLAGMRETHKDYLIRLLAHARAQLAVIGVELAERGLIAETSDVFFLELRDVKAALDGVDQHGVVAARRAEYDRELRRRHIPRVLLSDGTEPEALAAPPPDGALVGTPASAGTITGRVRVVLDPVDAALEPGEILVAPSTDPGWTPLFLTAGGLVMEMGGANSHGAVVAREYGIPAVVGVPDATTRLHTGQTVTVDGASGSVTADS
jgi:phosphohistidine swiveling domain-containing protein